MPQWTCDGGTQVKQSFARLTPDNLSNAGNMYTRLTGRLNEGTALPVCAIMFSSLFSYCESQCGLLPTQAISRSCMSARKDIAG